MRRSFALAAFMALTAQVPHALAQAILLTHEPSLTTYLPAASSLIQDIRPNATQRATELDGVPLRGAPSTFFPAANAHEAYPWHLWRWDEAGVDLAGGHLTLRERDLTFASASDGAWAVARSYNSGQGTSGSPHDSAGYQGNNWSQCVQPEILFHEAAEPEDDMLYLVHGAGSYSEYRRVGESSEVFRGVNGTGGAAHFEEDNEGPDLWTIYDNDGVRWVFFGHDMDSEPAGGSLWKRIGTDGLTSYFGDESDPGDAISLGFDSSGRPTTAYDTGGRRFDFTYSSGLLTEVDVLADPGSGYASLGASVVYTYYDGTDAHGSAGDLRSVTVTIPLSESGVNEVRTTLYRYWKGAHSSGNPGEDHLIRLIVAPEGFRAADMTDDGSLNGSAYSLSTDTLKPYALAYCEYDEDRRVVSLFHRGACGCSGASDAAYTIAYEANSSFSATSAYDTAWHSRAVIARPDGSFMTHYFDECGQALSRVFSDMDPLTETVEPAFWIDRIVRDANGRVTQWHTPAANDTYDHVSGDIETLEEAGLLHIYERLTSTDAAGLIEFECYQLGSDGDPYAEKKHAFDTVTLGVGGSSFSSARRTLSREYIVNDVGAGGRETAANYVQSTFAHAMWTGSAALRPKSITRTLPTVSSSTNGSGSALSEVRYHRADGTPAFIRHTDGTHNYTKYTGGLLTASVRDVDLTDTVTIASADDPSATFGISTNSDGVHLVTQRVYDDFGRLISEASPGGDTSVVHYTALADGRLVTLTCPLVQNTETTVYHGPVEYEVSLLNGGLSAHALIGFTSSVTSLEPADWTDEADVDPITALLTGELSNVEYHVRDLSGSRETATLAYTNVPGTGPGSPTTNFDSTLVHHDVFGRPVRTLGPDGTIRRTGYDVRGRIESMSVGTNDAGEPGGSLSGTNNMVESHRYEYDSGVVGNGLLTEVTRAPDSTTRVTTYTFDHRDRLVLTQNPAAPHVLLALDGLGRVTATGAYSSMSGLSASTNPVTTSTNRVALHAVQHDALGRVWRETRYAIASNGATSDSLDHDYWFDSAGRIIKSHANDLEKHTYDRVGRALSSSTLAITDDTTYAHAHDTAGDIVVEETHFSYESDDMEAPALLVSVARHHDDLANGTTGPLYSFGVQGRLKYVASNAEGRAAVNAVWYDSHHRPVTSATYGTNGGSDLDRANLAAPTQSSGTVLVTAASYDPFGRRETQTDENSVVNRAIYDDAARIVAEIRNYVDGTPSGGDDDVTTRLVYSAGRVVSCWADLDNDATIDTGEPHTQYEFGVTAGSGNMESHLTSNSLLSRVLLPGSTGAADSFTFAYNALGELTGREDQDGTVLVLDYDALGRLEHERAVDIDASLEDDVQRITRVFDSAGRLFKITQYTSPTPGSGSVIDEVEAIYNDWGGIKRMRQDHDSAVNVASGVDPYQVAFAFVKSTGTRRAIRRTSFTLPSDDVVTYSYLSTANRLDADLSRVTRTRLEGVTVAEYEHLGRTLRSEILLPEPVVFTTLGSSPAYAALDRFGRLVHHAWAKDLSTDVNFVDLQYTYGTGSDDADTLLRTEDSVHAEFDSALASDALRRLTSASRGTWTGSAISPIRDGETWSLSPASNATGYTLDADGDGAANDPGDVNETRAFSASDVLLSRTSSIGDPLVTLTHSPSGLLEDDGSTYECVYDAWGRLRELRAQGGTPVAYLRYNGQHQRITRQYDADGDTSIESHEIYHEVYDDMWQVVASYRSTDSSPKVQYVYHPQPMGDDYNTTDLLILRERDANTAWTTTSDGTLEERLYYTQDALGSTACILTAAGSQVEHFRASSYGRPFALPAGDTDSDGDWDGDDEAAITGSYDVRKDVNLDGTISGADVTQADAVAGGYQTLGAGVQSSASVGNAVTWSGYEADPVVGHLYHVRHRVYDALTQRWLTRDPLGFEDGANLYEYAASSPATSRDPSGLTWSACLKFEPYLVVGLTSDGWPLPPPNVVKGFDVKLRHSVHWIAGSTWMEVISKARVLRTKTMFGYLRESQGIANRGICMSCDTGGQISYKYTSTTNHTTGSFSVNAYINVLLYLSPANNSGLVTESWGDAVYSRKTPIPIIPNLIKYGKRLGAPGVTTLTSTSPIRTHAWECRCCKWENAGGEIIDHCRSESK